MNVPGSAQRSVQAWKAFTRGAALLAAAVSALGLLQVIESGVQASHDDHEHLEEARKDVGELKRGMGEIRENAVRTRTDVEWLVRWHTHQRH